MSSSSSLFASLWSCNCNHCSIASSLLPYDIIARRFLNIKDCISLHTVHSTCAANLHVSFRVHAFSILLNPISGPSLTVRSVIQVTTEYMNSIYTVCSLHCAKWIALMSSAFIVIWRSSGGSHSSENQLLSNLNSYLMRKITVTLLNYIALPRKQRS